MIRNMIRVATCLLLFGAQILKAQPGGGGRINLAKIYTLQGQIIENSELKIRAFSLQDTTRNSLIKAEIYDAQKTVNRSYLHLPGGSSRLYIIYQNESMILDLHGVIPPNGAGNRQRMDSLVFQPGHFRYFTNVNPHQKFYRIQSDHTLKITTSTEEHSIFEVLNFGLTPYVRKYLSEFLFTANYNTDSRQNKSGQDQKDLNTAITYWKTVDTTFLLRKNLPATYYLSNAFNLHWKGKTLAAFSELEQAIIIGLKDEDLRRALNLQCNLYTEAKKNKKAIKSISALILLDSAHRNYHYGLINLFDDYKIRIELYIKTRQFRKALKDYKTMISFSNLDKQYYTTSMAAFKARYLHDYNGAISDLKSIIDTIPDNHMFNRLMGYSTYSRVYFTLGQTEYGKGDQSSAFRHWLKAEEIGTASLKTTHYDLLIKKHPEVPELYVARGLVNSHNAIYQKDSLFLKAINDFNTAEKLGYKDFRVNMFRAVSFMQLKNYKKALSEINIAIAKNDQDPRTYKYRYDIRKRMDGMVGNGDGPDADLIKYEKLSRTWTFTKY